MTCSCGYRAPHNEETCIYRKMRPEHHDKPSHDQSHCYMTFRVWTNEAYDGVNDESGYVIKYCERPRNHPGFCNTTYRFPDCVPAHD